MVYGVFGGEYSDWFVVGYFESKKDAEVYCNLHNAKCEDSWDEYYIKPLLNLVDNEPNIYRQFTYSEYRDEVWKEDDMVSNTKEPTFIVDYGNGVRCVNVWMNLCDFSKERVRKIAQDALAKHDAEKAGIV